MNTVGEMKDIYVIASHVGISGDRITAFLNTAKMAGYVLVREKVAETLSPAAPRETSKEG